MDPADVGSVDLEDLETITSKVGHALSPQEVREAVDKAVREWDEKLSENYPVIGHMSGRSVSGPNPPLAVLESLRGHEGAAPVQGMKGSGDAAAGLGPGRLELVSRKPRAYLQRRFLSQAECRQIVNMTLRQQDGAVFHKKVRAPLIVDDDRWNADEKAFLQDMENRIAALTGGAPHEDEAALVGTLTPPGCEESISGHLGLHVDTNAAHWRYCTAIVYLSSVPSGGETVFPAAVSSRDGLPSEEEERALEAAGRLLELGIDHTDKALQAGPSAVAVAQELLEVSKCSSAGVRVAPEEGSVCIFWTRLDDGEIDRHSWHGGAPVPGGDAWKWTLQKFKEVPPHVRGKPQELAAWVRDTRRKALLRE